MSRNEIDQIWSYMEGEMTEEQAVAFEERLALEPSFRDLFQEQQGIFRSLSKTETIEFRKKVQQIARQVRKEAKYRQSRFPGNGWLLAAAMGLIMISTGYVLINLLESPSAESNSGKPSVQNHPVDTTGFDSLSCLSQSQVTKDSTELLAAIPEGISGKSEPADLAEAFKENPQLEEWVDIHYRSTNLTVQSPHVGQVFPKEVPIRFLIGPLQADSVSLVIIDNRGSVLLNSPYLSGEWILRKELPAGLYYFQLTTPCKVLYTGKFYRDYR